MLVKVYYCIYCKIGYYSMKDYKKHVVEKHAKLTIEEIGKTYLRMGIRDAG